MALLIPSPAADPLPTEYSPPFETAIFTALVVLVVYLVGRFLVVTVLTRIIRARNPDNPTLVAATQRYLTFLVVVVAVVAGAWAAGFGHVVAQSSLVVAALTLALGVAGQEVIGDLVSGVFLVADPEFNVDDWIRWDGGEGVVETIRFRVTRVRTPDNEVITVPNTTLATSAVTRPFGRDPSRVAVRLALSTSQDIDDAVATIREAIETATDSLDDPDPAVLVDDIDESAVWIHAEFWLRRSSPGEIARIRSNVLTHLKERLQADDVDFSPPSEHALTGQLQVDQSDTGD